MLATLAKRVMLATLAEESIARYARRVMLATLAKRVVLATLAE